MACPSMCPFWDSADVKRIEGWEQQEPGQRRQCHPPPPRPLGDFVVGTGQTGTDSTGPNAGPGLQCMRCNGNRPGVRGPPSTGDRKPPWGSQPAQGLLYLTPLIQLGLGRVIREVQPIRGLASRALPGKEATGE